MLVTYDNHYLHIATNYFKVLVICELLKYKIIFNLKSFSILYSNHKYNCTDNTSNKITTIS